MRRGWAVLSFYGTSYQAVEVEYSIKKKGPFSGAYFTRVLGRQVAAANAGPFLLGKEDVFRTEEKALKRALNRFNADIADYERLLNDFKKGRKKICERMKSLGGQKTEQPSAKTTRRKSTRKKKTSRRPSSRVTKAGKTSRATSAKKRSRKS